VLSLLTTTVLAASLACTTAAESQSSAHRLVLQVDSDDPHTMNLVLNNATAATQYYTSRHETVVVEIVAYGPGLHMLRADTSPIKARLDAFHKKLPETRFSACNNTLQGMENAEGKKIELLPWVTVVPSGVVRVMELEEQGWSYVRP
jgi:uncharacterized protein